MMVSRFLSFVSSSEFSYFEHGNGLGLLFVHARGIFWGWEECLERVLYYNCSFEVYIDKYIDQCPTYDIFHL